MTMQTKLKHAFEEAGLHQRDVEFDIAIAKYLNSGGTWDDAYARLLARKPMPGEGQLRIAGDGQSSHAPSRQPVEDAAGQGPHALPGRISDVRPSSSNPSGEGQVTGASHGHEPYAIPAGPQLRGGEGRLRAADKIGQRAHVLPVRDANTKRGLTSIKAVQPTIKQGLLELKKTTDGRAWGSVGWHELDGMDRDGAIARLVKQQVNPPRDQFSPLRSFVSNKQFEEIVSAAQKQNDFV
jgi:hypothetical protein